MSEKEKKDVKEFAEILAALNDAERNALYWMALGIKAVNGNKEVVANAPSDVR